MDEQEKTPIPARYEDLIPAHELGEFEEATIRILFTQFATAFLKVSSLTGYYPSDHPAIQDIAGEPHQHLARLSAAVREVGFVTTSGSVDEEIMVDLLSEPIPFLTMMRSAMAETFAQKFITYLERNYLVSFTIKTAITFDEFKRFVALFVERKTKQDEGVVEALETSFAEQLIEREIFSVTVISRDDIIGGQRSLPWRVKIAISRLKKDLAVLPMYSKASDMELQAAKQLIIGDIIRPLRRPRFLRELLVNADLIRGQVDELATVNVEQEIIDCLSAQMVEAVAWDIEKVLQKASWGVVVQQDGDEERRIDDILKNILNLLATRLVGMDVSQTYDLLLHLFELRILSFASLPVDLQQLMQAEKWTNQYLLEEDNIVALFSAMEDTNLYRAYLQNISLVFPELLKKGKIASAARLVKILSVHARDHDHQIRQGMAQIALMDLGSQETVDLLRPFLEHDDRPTRQVAIAMVRQFSYKGTEVLLEVLAESDDAAVRRDVLATLEKMGVTLRSLLEERLQIPGQPWYVYRNLLLLVGRVGSEVALEEVKRFVNFMDPRVREQALQTLFSQLQDKAIPSILPALRDRDWHVARRGVILLSDLNCRHPIFLKYLSALFHLVEQIPGQERTSALRKAGLHAIERLGNFDVDGRRISSVLLDVVIAKRRRKLLKKLIDKVTRGGESAFADDLRVEVCRVLGRIGDAKVAHVLAEAPEDFPAAVETALEEAIGEINAREHGA
ncbi:MAG: HEAT repeat domain-containing protein [Pseudomonadota bacterium]